MDRPRLVSTIIAVLFFIIANTYLVESNEDIVLIILYLIFCIALIWYGDELGNLTGVRFGDFASPHISKTTPGWIVRLMGWALLTIPFILIIGKLILSAYTNLQNKSQILK